MCSLNDIVVVGNDQFYFTNYFHSIDYLEFLLQLHWGSLGFFDRTGSTLMETSLFIPNGVSVSPDGRFVDYTFDYRECVCYTTICLFVYFS